MGARLGRFAMYGRGLQVNMTPEMSPFLLLTIKLGASLFVTYSQILLSTTHKSFLAI